MWSETLQQSVESIVWLKIVPLLSVWAWNGFWKCKQNKPSLKYMLQTAGFPSRTGDLILVLASTSEMSRQAVFGDFYFSCPFHKEYHTCYIELSECGNKMLVTKYSSEPDAPIQSDSTNHGCAITVFLKWTNTFTIMGQSYATY